MTRYRGLLKESNNQIWTFCPTIKTSLLTVPINPYKQTNQVQRPSPRSRHRNLYSFQGQVWEGSNIVQNPDTSMIFSISVQLWRSLYFFRILFAGHYLTAEREGGAVVIYYRWQTSNFCLLRKMILADSYFFTLSTISTNWEHSANWAVGNICGNLLRAEKGISRKAHFSSPTSVQ